MIFYGQNSYADNLLSSVKKMSRIFQTIETLKTYKVAPQKEITQILKDYSEKEFGLRDVIQIKKYLNESTTPTINAPYLITVSAPAKTLEILREEIKLFAERKHLTLAKTIEIRDAVKKITQELSSLNYQFSFDGGAENSCEAPTRRLIVYKPLSNVAYAFNLEEC